MVLKIVEEEKPVEPKEEVTAEEKKPEEVKKKIKVVKELLTQQIRETTDEKTGEITLYLTVEEALQMLVGGSE